MSKINELVDITKDIISHPEDDLEYLEQLFKEASLSEADIEEINSAFRVILSQEGLSDEKKVDYTNNLWKVNFNKKPPTPQEFLTEEWIGETANSLYPHIRKSFEDFFNPLNPYRNLVEYYPIGTGKSVLVALIKGYIAAIDYYLRDFKQFFNLGQTTMICDATVSLSLDMAYDLNIAPMLNYMETSPKFCRVKQEAQLIRKRKEDPNTIYFTTATKGGSILRVGDLFYRTISEPAQLLGLTLQVVSLTELGFLQEKGMKADTVMRLLNDSKGRIYSRFGNHYLARSVIDSSPNDLNNPVDRFIMYDCIKDPSVLRLMGKKWELQPHLFPLWQESNETFPMFKGNASKEPKILNEGDIEFYDVNDVINVPIDIKQLAIDSPHKTMKDYCGFPSGSDAKLISNPDMIDNLFTDNLRNFYSFKNAPADQPPEGLLWDIVKKEFFVYTGQGSRYEFYRLPKIERFISIDLAKKFDMATISMSHIERNIKNEKIYIVDFSLPIMSTKVEINLDAFKFLILDMVKYGGINVKKVSFDQFQSDSSRQFLIRHNIDAIRYSVDISTEPYLSFISYMSQERVKMGKNLIMKNNMKSLVNVKKDNGKNKIDHEQGDWLDLTNLDWDKSRMGYYGKDLSDSVVASCMLADLYGTDSADYIWDESRENYKKQNTVENLKEDLYKKFNFKIRKEGR